MKKKKTNKKIASALAMLMLSAAMLGTSTYAWFTMNKTVTVTGMEMKTKVSGNLLVCANNVEEDYSSTGLSQTRAALLEPVSSVSGATGSFYYTVDGKADGDANADIYIPYDEDTALTGGVDIISTTNNKTRSSTGAGKVNYDDDFNGSSKGYNLSASAAPVAAYTNGYGYVDYVFYLKATADATNGTINMTKCNLLYNGTSGYEAVNTTGTVGTDVDKAWRVAVFSSEINDGGSGTLGSDNATSGNLKGILTLNGAHTQNYDSAAASPKEQAVNGTGANFGDVTYNSLSAIGTVSDKQTKYYMVTVRVWLEGEDTTCTSATYAQLTNNWKLDTEFSIDSTKSAVTMIGSSTN